MPYGAREKKIRNEARKRGIKSIRTVDIPGDQYAHVYITQQAPKKRKGVR